MPSISEENQEAKNRFIKSAFDDFEKKADYLVELCESGHRDEARILCSCYIDGLASALCWPDKRTNFNYVRCLIEYGGDEMFSLIHPKMLDEAIGKLSARGAKWKAIYKSVSTKLQKVDRRLFKKQEMLDLLEPLLEMSETGAIKRELWRGTFAAIIYDRFRVAAVHGFGPSDAITFDETTFHGKPVPEIDFFMVLRSLKRIIGVAREKSEQTGKWFGHDFKME